jgi:hypothetical protein
MKEIGRSQVNGLILNYISRVEKAVNEELHGDIAQLGERRLCKAEVTGSIPVISRKYKKDVFRIYNPKFDG